MKKLFAVCLMLLSCIAFAEVQEGYAVLDSNGSRAIVLSTNTVFSDDEMMSDNYFDYEQLDIIVEPWDQPAWCANYVDLAGTFEKVKTIPTSGYFDDGKDYQDCDYVEQGVYAIKTRDGNYAVVEITDTEHYNMTEGGFRNRVMLNYRIQTDGTTNLAPGASIPPSQYDGAAAPDSNETEDENETHNGAGFDASEIVPEGMDLGLENIDVDDETSCAPAKFITLGIVALFLFVRH